MWYLYDLGNTVRYLEYGDWILFSPLLIIFTVWVVSYLWGRK